MPGEVSISEVRGPWGWTMIVLRAGISLKEVCMWGVGVEVLLVMKMVLLIKRAKRISTWASFSTALNFIILVLPIHWREIMGRKMR